MYIILVTPKARKHYNNICAIKCSASEEISTIILKQNPANLDGMRGLIGDPITIINEHLFFYNTTLVQITKVSRFRTQIYAKE